MKIAIIGSGFTGLAAAWDLQRAGHQVSVFEKTDRPGGLASGWQEPEWDWSLDFHYHHIFQTDASILQWLQEMGLREEVFFSNTKTSTLFQKKIWQLDSPLSLLRFSPLSFFDRLRTGLVLAGLKLIPDGQWLERWTAAVFLTRTMGKKAYQVLWQPLLVGKFGKHAEAINMAWFWARIKARSQKLGYMRGGFLQLVQKITALLKKEGIRFFYNADLQKIVVKDEKNILQFKKNKKHFDVVLSTVPSEPMKKILAGSPEQKLIQALPGLGAMTLVLELEKPFFSQNNYWLNINNSRSPFLAVVEHTHLTGKKVYGGKSLLYVGKYLDSQTAFFKQSAAQVLQKYRSSLDDLSPGFAQTISRFWLHKAPFAQPLVFKNHSPKVPPLSLKKGRLYWASMQHVYPWDRGTNFAVQAGRKVAQKIIDDVI